MCQKIKPRHAHVNDIVAINLTLLIIPKASAQTFDSTQDCQRLATWHGTIRKRKGTPYKTNCHEQEKGVAVPPLSRDDKSGVGRPRASRHSPDLFTHSPSAPHRSLPPRFDTVLKVVLPPFYLPVVVPSLPATSVTTQEDSLPTSPKGRPDTAPMRITELIRRTRCIIVSVLRSVERNSKLYKFLTRTTR